MTKKQGKNTLQVTVDESVPSEKALADTATNGFATSAILVQKFCGFGDLDSTACMRSVKEKANAIKDGNTEHLETMLASQAIALDSMFANMATLAKANFPEHFRAGEKFMRLALKAQSQCRTTVEAIAEMKNPQPFIQNNKAEYQQVNNHAGENCDQVRTPAHVREN